MWAWEPQAARQRAREEMRWEESRLLHTHPREKRDFVCVEETIAYFRAGLGGVVQDDHRSIDSHRKSKVQRQSNRAGDN